MILKCKRCDRIMHMYIDEIRGDKAHVIYECALCGNERSGLEEIKEVENAEM